MLHSHGPSTRPKMGITCPRGAQEVLDLRPYTHTHTQSPVSISLEDITLTGDSALPLLLLD